MNTHTHVGEMFLPEDEWLTLTVDDMMVIIMIWLLDRDSGDGDLTLDTVGGEEGNVAGFQGVVMSTVR